MSGPTGNSDELPRLLSALVDGTLDAADEERLEALLQADAAARAKYYDHVMLAAMLQREGRRAAAQSEERSDLEAVEAVSTLTDASGKEPLPSPLPKGEGVLQLPLVARRLRPWQWVLAASILLCLLLSVGEATGVTEFVPTIIRIVTGEGSLVIEVDDPTVSVTLDGEDVTITGAGVHELRLRPGTHKFVATKDGRPLREEVVSIERNGRRMVKVTRDATVEPIAHELTASEKLQRAKIDLSEADRIRIEATQALEEIKHGAELARLNAAIERNPTDVESLVHRGELYRRLNRLDEAMADYTAALTIAPDHPICVAALSSRGQILTDRGEYKAAIADYEHAIRLAPNNAWPYGRIATIYLFGSDDIRDGQKALDFADQSTQHRDAHRGFHVLRGVCLYRLGRYREAAEALERTYVAEGRTAMNRFYAALSYHQLGDTDKAKKCYEEALKLPQVGGYVGDAIRAEADALLNQ